MSHSPAAPGATAADTRAGGATGSAARATRAAPSRADTVTGIGGRSADPVGRSLWSLGRRHQVLCVTHLPQIASYADRHVRVGKRQARGRTEVEVDVLDDDGKVEELARMLAGETVTPAALRHAAEMRARGYKPAVPEA